jgi:hypothetical protein
LHGIGLLGRDQQPRYPELVEAALRNACGIGTVGSTATRRNCHVGD